METKIKALNNSMEEKERNNGEKFTCFSDSAPEELKNLFLTHYEVKDIDYKTFSKAIDTIIEVWENNENHEEESLKEYIDENYNDFASPYNAERLSYLDVWNDSEVSNIVKEYSCETISEACAIWFDRQVKEAANLILEWIMAK